MLFCVGFRPKRHLDVIRLERMSSSDSSGDESLDDESSDDEDERSASPDE